ncbi:hypothetical protein A11A3_01025 [Alcanivorax hongdengensis A-11-3]|uniref:PNPLA domain-containing protein n=1 Tax=Alcanivorax hongdengensis A-11-3 TaxID=1177179 RepID=L0WGQ0_9GAMM|nr:patatin family protein [Alcanivorax hongdengensis]EKF76033.1 hypothetical protein A11A3_01025 [Alcanivorax hongdengensis A-11-3]
MSRRALVVEGGAMRGIFAAGVLDAFLESGHRGFDFAVGVSAGSTNLIGYLAGDHGRSRRIITDHACRPDFINWKRFASGGHLCDVHWLWHQSLKEVPLSLERHWQGEIPLWVVTTSARDGSPCYFRARPDNLDHLVTASCSIPLAYRGYPAVEGQAMTDGGLADSIPVQWAYRQGARDITVVLSRPQGYRKRPDSLAPLLRPFMKDAPGVYHAMRRRAHVYNASLDFIASPPPDCRVRVVAPDEDFPVRRLTTDGARLARGYEQGRQAGQQIMATIL